MSISTLQTAALFLLWHTNWNQLIILLLGRRVCPVIKPHSKRSIGDLSRTHKHWLTVFSELGELIWSSLVGVLCEYGVSDNAVGHPIPVHLYSELGLHRWLEVKIAVCGCLTFHRFYLYLCTEFPGAVKGLGVSGWFQDLVSAFCKWCSSISFTEWGPTACAGLLCSVKWLEWDHYWFTCKSTSLPSPITTSCKTETSLHLLA